MSRASPSVTDISGMIVPGRCPWGFWIPSWPPGMPVENVQATFKWPTLPVVMYRPPASVSRSNLMSRGQPDAGNSPGGSARPLTVRRCASAGYLPAFLRRLSSFFSFGVRVGAFLTFFFASWLLLMTPESSRPRRSTPGSNRLVLPAPIQYID